MADKAISGLSHGATPATSSKIESEEGGASVYYTLAEIFALLAANPSGTAKDTAVNGVATTFMRSDAAPAIQKATDLLFGLVKVDGTTITASSGVISAVSQGMTVKTETGPAYTLVLADANKWIECNNASPFTLTVPANADVALPIGTTINLSQLGAGVITVDPAVGVTLQSAGGLLDSDGQYTVLGLTKVATNIWRVYGNLA